MSNWLEGDLVVGGAPIHYYRTGGGGKSIVLVHGFTDNGLCWTPVARELEASYDLVMVDARGHGRSAPVAATPTVDIVADLASVIEQLALDRPAVLGHSMGAAVAALLAARYPALVGAVLLEDPPWWPVTPERDPAQEAAGWRIAMQKWERDMAALRTKTLDEIIAFVRAAHPSWSEDELGPWARSKLELDMDIYHTALYPQQPWPELVPQIQCPALLITGDTKLGAIVTPEVAEQVLAALPCGCHAHIPGAGHNVRRDQFRLYMDAVQRFLADWERGLCGS